MALVLRVSRAARALSAPSGSRPAVEIGEPGGEVHLGKPRHRLYLEQREVCPP